MISLTGRQRPSTPKPLTHRRRRRGPPAARWSWPPRGPEDLERLAALLACTPGRARAPAALQGAGVATLGLRADATDEQALRAALDRAVEAHGLPDVLVYNAGLIRADRPGELSARVHQEAWAINVVGAITAAGHLGPAWPTGEMALS